MTKGMRGIGSVGDIATQPVQQSCINMGAKRREILRRDQEREERSDGGKAVHTKIIKVVQEFTSRYVQLII